MKVSNFIVFHLIVSFQFMISSPLTALKSSLMTEYNAQVSAQKVSFLKQYGLTEQDIDQFSDREQFKASHDEMVKKAREQYTIPEAAAKRQALQKVQDVAQHVFAECGLDKVEILHAHDSELSGICVMQLYVTGMVYIQLNAVLHATSLDVLADLLRHEASHIVYKDNLLKDIMGCIAWCHSQESPEQIQEKLYPFCRSFEVRADVYAALHSPGYAKLLMIFLKQLPVDGPATHPKPAERITLLEHIQARLADTITE